MTIRVPDTFRHWLAHIDKSESGRAGGNAHALLNVNEAQACEYEERPLRTLRVVRASTSIDETHCKPECKNETREQDDRRQKAALHARLRRSVVVAVGKVEPTEQSKPRGRRLPSTHEAICARLRLQSLTEAPAASTHSPCLADSSSSGPLTAKWLTLLDRGSWNGYYLVESVVCLQGRERLGNLNAPSATTSTVWSLPLLEVNGHSDVEIDLGPFKRCLLHCLPVI
jgi:hypothetical protein